MLCNTDGVEGCPIFRGKARYEGVRFNVISVTRGRVGVQIPGKKHYVTVEWPLSDGEIHLFPVCLQSVE